MRRERCWIFGKLVLIFAEPSATKLMHQNPLTMSKTFTPTHCPETGRKFTKAERKAANKAKFAALRAEQAALPKPTQEAKPRKAQAKAVTAPASPSVTDLKVLMRHNKAELCQMIQGYQAASVAPATPAKPKASKPAKAVRSRKPNANERLEARMQRESTRKREAMLAKADERSRKVVDAATGKDAEAFAERKEVYVAPAEHKAKREDKPQLAGLQGLSPEDAVRRDALLREREALEQALLADFEGFEDSPF